jgi:hypothetical protein
VQQRAARRELLGLQLGGLEAEYAFNVARIDGLRAAMNRLWELILVKRQEVDQMDQ